MPNETCPVCHRAVNCYGTRYVMESPGCRNEATQRMCYSCAESLERWPMGANVEDATCIEMGTSRRFGVEIETSACSHYARIKDKSHFGAKIDGSVSGMEFVSPILQGDAGLAEVRKFLQYANRYKFRVNSDCGLHVHIDARDLTALQKRKVNYAFIKTYGVWQSLVTEYRAHDCNWTHATNYNCDEVRSCRRFDTFASRQSRYQWFNLAAIEKHGTFEVRLYQGTLNANEICNWIKALLRFADAVKDMKYQELDNLLAGTAVRQFEGIKRLWRNKGLSRYYNKRTRLHVDHQGEARRRSARFNDARRAVLV